MKAKYFDIKRDLRIIKKDGFMCNGCLVAKPLSQQSPKDAQYCVDCQAFIEQEYTITADLTGRKSKYNPVAPVGECLAKEKEVLLPTNLESAHEYQNLPPTPTISPGGRPRKDIPVDLVHKLSKQGLGVKKIARELNISAMTISRVLSGERSS